MSFRGALLGGIIAAGVGLSGAGVTAALMDVPQDAVPVSQDPVGDALRAAQPAPTPVPATVPEIPAGTPGIIVIDPAAPAPQEEVPADVEVAEEPETEDVAEVVPEVVEPTVRRRHRIALVHAIDKTTAESMQFEVEVGGRPVRFARSLVFKVRACEVTGANELTEDSIAYVEAGIQPRSEPASNEARQIFKGWMFASSPSLNGLEHPVYDAWVVGCKD